jgi:peptidoglycan/xylan/chitin deacetylase (PgdA/CDA1 family)
MMERPMRRIVLLAMLVAMTQAVAAAPVDNPALARHTAHKHATHKKHVHHRSPYGFLPGYEPPAVAEARREREYRETHPYTFYGPAWPRFYRGRWNGGGFGPCYTQTPIGPMWNCGN